MSNAKLYTQYPTPQPHRRTVIYKRKRDALMQTFDEITMNHRVRLYQLLQLPKDEQTHSQVSAILDDLNQQLKQDIPTRLNYLTER